MDLPIKGKIRYIWNKIIELFNINKQQDNQLEILKQEIENLRLCITANNKLED